MKKGFLFFLMLFGVQVLAYSNTEDSTSFFSELLLWNTSVVDDDNWGQILGPTGTNQQIQFLNAPFHWSPGFRVGLHYAKKENPWDLLIYFTWFKTQATNQVSINSGELHSAFLGAFFSNNSAGDGLSGPYYHQGGITRKVLLSTVDAELGRPIEPNNLVSLRPFIGIRAGMINQALNTNWQQPFNNTTKLPITTYSSAVENVTNNFQGVGPSIGIDSRWHLLNAPKYTLNFIGNISAALLWANFSLKDVYQDNTPESVTILNDTLKTAVPMVKGQLGIQWSNCLNVDNFNVTLGYEAQSWFNQLRYYNFDRGRENASLFFQGGVLDFSIHFL